MPPNEEEEESKNESMEMNDEEDMCFGDDFDFMDIEFDSDEDSDDGDSDTFVLQVIINHILNDEGKLTMIPNTRYFNAAKSLIRIMCEFDDDAKILSAKEPNAKSKHPPLPPIMKPEEVPKRTDKLGKYLVVSNQNALRLNQKDLKGHINIRSLI